MKAVLGAEELKEKGIELGLKGKEKVHLQSFQQDSFWNMERLGRWTYLLLKASEQKFLQWASFFHHFPLHARGLSCLTSIKWVSGISHEFDGQTHDS